MLHHDGTARLQTVNAEQNALVHELLIAYHRLSGVPLLCNTSANLKQKGFFPDIASAASWGGATMVWSEGRLYRDMTATAAAPHPAEQMLLFPLHNG